MEKIKEYIESQVMECDMTNEVSKRKINQENMIKMNFLIAFLSKMHKEKYQFNDVLSEIITFYCDKNQLRDEVDQAMITALQYMVKKE